MDRGRGSRKTEVKSERPSSSKKIRSFDNNEEKNAENGLPPDLGLNPLNISVILKIILSNFEKVEDLKNVRAVSKLWMEESLGKWRSTAVLRLKPKVLRALLKACAKEENEEELFFNLFEKPFLNFRYAFPLPVPEYRSYPLLKASEEELARTFSSPALWEHFFSKAKYLDIDDCLLNRCRGGYVEGLKWILKTCPDLKALDINPHRDTTSVASPFPEEIEHNIISKLEYLTFGRSVNSCFRRKYPPILDSVEDVAELQEFFKMMPNLKHLSTHSGSKNRAGEIENSLILSKALEFKYKLESITLVALRSGDEVNLEQLEDYLRIVQPQVKNLVLTVHWKNCVSFFDRANRHPLFTVLDRVASTLTKLELYIGCDFTDRMTKKCFVDLSDEWRTDFPVLTHLKLSLSYTHFFGNLPSFCFGSLMKMKKLKEFSFETKDKVASGWVSWKLKVKNLQPKRNMTSEEKKNATEEMSLPDLERFHFHGNFTLKAMKLLGKWAPNIKTLEVVLDKENFNTALKTWPGANRVRLLPGSEVPEELFPKESKQGRVVLDNSQDYLKAWNGHGDCRFYEDVDFDVKRKFCLQTKAYKN